MPDQFFKHIHHGKIKPVTRIIIFRLVIFDSAAAADQDFKFLNWLKAIANTERILNFVINAFYLIRTTAECILKKPIIIERTPIGKCAIVTIGRYVFIPIGAFRLTISLGPRKTIEISTPFFFNL